MPPFPKHAAALKWALNEQAHHVQEIPLGSNRGPRVEYYQSFDWIPGGGYPWCVDFVQAAWAEGAGQPLPWKTAGAYDLLDRAKKQGGWTCPLSLAVPGDIIVWNIGSGHASMLRVPWKGGNGLVATVDGNVSDRVDLRERPASLVRGVVHIPEHMVTPPKVKPPMFEVVGSESGHSVIVYVSGPKAIGRVMERLLMNHKGGLTIRPKKK